MKIKDIITVANTRTEQQIDPTTQGVLFVNEAIALFNSKWGIMVPFVPTEDPLEHIIEFTQKLGDADPNDPDRERVQAEINKYNTKMTNIDNTLQFLITKIVIYYIWMADDDETQAGAQMNIIQNEIAKSKGNLYPFIHPDFKYEYIAGNKDQSGSALYSLGIPKHQTSVENWKQRNKK